METRTKKSLLEERRLGMINESVKKEYETEQIAFRDAVRGFWEHFDDIYGTNLTYEKIRDYDNRNGIQ